MAAPLKPEEPNVRQLFALLIMAMTLGAWTPTAAAQLTDILDLVDDVVDDLITDRVEDTIIDDVVDAVEDQVLDQLAARVDQTIEQSVQGVVDSKIGESVTRTVDDTVGRTLETVGNVLQPVLDPVVGPLTRQVNRTVEQTFGVLPALNTPREVPVENNWRAVQNEWIALIGADQVAALQNPALQVLQVTPLEASGQVLVRVAVSDQDNNAARAQQLLRSLGATAADRNHVYFTNAGPDVDEPAPEPAPAPAKKKSGARVGLIDTSLSLKHPALKGANIGMRDFVDGKKPRPTAHGTGIASLLVGAEKGHEGLLQGGQLIAASVFYQGDSGATGATTSSLVASLDWMAQNKVQVVNMSLAGPPNEVLGAMIARLSKQGMLVVAAVGNDGPASRPLYPAAFEPVVAVTAVDHKSQIYRWANQGPQVDLAAWGVSSRVAKDKGGYTDESGTSYAAPVVSAALAETIANGAGNSSAALKSIISAAEDLGDKGRDNVYGYGLVKLP
jgi:minor extracellular protease Epr